MFKLMSRERITSKAAKIIISLCLLSGVAAIETYEHQKQLRQEQMIAQQVTKQQQLLRAQQSIIQAKDKQLDSTKTALKTTQSQAEQAKQKVAQLEKQVQRLSGRSESLGPLQGAPMTMVATWYDSQGGINGTGITKTGTVPQDNRTIAVDPSVIPLHAHVYVRFADGHGQEYIAEDTGSAIIGDRIDIYDSNPTACFDNGRQTVQVWVLK